MFRYFGADPSKKWTKEELIAYDNASIAKQDARGRLIAAKKEGKIEGKMENKIEVIAKCLQEGMSPEVISRLVELPLYEVQKIITQLGV